MNFKFLYRFINFHWLWFWLLHCSLFHQFATHHIVLVLQFLIFSNSDYCKVEWWLPCKMIIACKTLHPCNFIKFISEQNAASHQIEIKLIILGYKVSNCSILYVKEKWIFLRYLITCENFRVIPQTVRLRILLSILLLESYNSH